MSYSFRVLTALLLIVAVVGCSSSPPAQTKTDTPAQTKGGTAAQPKTDTITPTKKDAPVETKKDAPAQAKTEKINMAYSSTAANMAFPQIIKDAGIFAKNGLDVEIVSIIGGSPTAMALIAGDIQFADVTGVPIVESYLNGANILLLAGLLNYFEHRLIGKDVEKLADLKGKRVGIQKFGDITDSGARYFLKKAGLEPGKDVALLEVGGPPERLAAMMAGAVDVILLSEPQLTQAKQQGFKEIVFNEKIEYQGAAMAATSAFIKSRPETVRKFIKSTVEGIHFAKTNKQSSMKSIASFVKMSADNPTVELAYNTLSSSLVQVPYPTVNGVQFQIDDLAPKYEKAKTMKPAEVIDASFVKELDDSGFIKKLYEK